MGFVSPASSPKKRVITFSDFRILYLLQGKGRYSDDTHDNLELSPGSFLLRPPNHRHVIERFSIEPWKEFAFVLPMGLYDQLRAIGVIPDSPLHYQWPVTEPIRNRLDDLYDWVDHLPPSQSATLLYELQGVLLEATTTPGRHSFTQFPDYVQRAMAILGSDLGVPITMPTVAKRVGMGYHAFRKGFARHVGLSPKEYRIRRVIEGAQELLMDPGLGLKDIAYDLGYPDPHSFSKQFKRVTGQSPSLFRRA